MQMGIQVLHGRLKNNFEPSPAPSLVKVEKQFRQCVLKKVQNPDIFDIP
jgi:hypothetical protein